MDGTGEASNSQQATRAFSMNDNDTIYFDAAEEFVGDYNEALHDFNVALEHELFPPKEAFLRFMGRIHGSLRNVTKGLGKDWQGI